MQNIVNNKRILSYDIIRIIACLSVIMLHSAAPLVDGYSVNTAHFVMGNIFDGISRIGVPLFIMLSGALMLNEDKQISIRKNTKNIFRIFGLLYIWSLLYAVLLSVILPLVRNEAISINKFFYQLIFGEYHLWYLFMIIGLYAVTPILRIFVKKENKKLIEYFLIISIIFKFCVPLVNFFLNRFLGIDDYFYNYIQKFQLGFIGDSVTYYILGWYVSNIEIRKRWRILIYALGFAGFTITILGTQFFSSGEEKVNTLFYSNGIINVLLSALSVFVFIYYYFNGKSAGKFSGLIIKLSNLTFGVYACHLVFLFVAIDIFAKVKLPILLILLCFVFTTVFSFIGIYIISKIPFLRKIIKA